MDPYAQRDHFDPEHFIPMSAAMDVVKLKKPKASGITVRKFLVGAAIHCSDSGLETYAERFDECYERIDDKRLPNYRSRPETFSPLDANFWRIGMAIAPDAELQFQDGNISCTATLSISELPYRLRKHAATELQNERIRLTQSAWGIHFPTDRLLALTADKEWMKWGEIGRAVSDRGLRGRPPRWKWDEAKVELTLEASRNPEILQKGSGPIVQFLTDYLAHLHYGDAPDEADIRRYALLFQGRFLDEGPAPD